MGHIMILHDVKYADFQGFNIKPGDSNIALKVWVWTLNSKQKLMRRAQIYMDKSE